MWWETLTSSPYSVSMWREGEITDCASYTVVSLRRVGSWSWQGALPTCKKVYVAPNLVDDRMVPSSPGVLGHPQLQGYSPVTLG